MKKKGFTLIELLAVIVILAIIALIATPLVLKYIEKSRSESKVDSAYSYVRNLETEIANFSIKNNGKKYTTDKESIKELGLDITVKGENPEDGKVCISGVGQIEKGVFQYGKYYVSYDGKKGSISDKDTYDNFSCSNDELFKACILAPNGDVAPKGISEGDKYLCKVKKNMEPEYEQGYTFYVLSENEDETINLILERNICLDGTLTDTVKNDKCLVTWSLSNYNADGPVAAMDYLYDATKDWENIPNIVMNYIDEGNIGTYGYGTIITTNNITKITKKDESPIIVLIDQEGYSNLKARMPYKREIIDSNIQTDVIGGISGYWTLSAHDGSGGLHRFAAYSINIDGSVVTSGVSVNLGVRPVITIPKSKL